MSLCHGEGVADGDFITLILASTGCKFGISCTPSLKNRFKKLFIKESWSNKRNEEEQFCFNFCSVSGFVGVIKKQLKSSQLKKVLQILLSGARYGWKSFIRRKEEQGKKQTLFCFTL